MKIDGKITTPFPINQGCVISPLLFNIFMAELAKSLASLENGFQMDNSKINSIFWADDIVLLCEDGSQLDKMLKMIGDELDRRGAAKVPAPSVTNKDRSHPQETTPENTWNTSIFI